MPTDAPLPRVVIVGGGFGGIAAARALRRAPVEVVLIDRHNHHLFQPLLYQVATAALSPADIAWPIRRILRHQQNARVLMAEVTGIDTANRKVLLGNSAEPYDFLVLACGASHDYFGNEDWARYAPGLKDLTDAVAIRRQILLAFERAEISNDVEEQTRQLTFAVIGGGPTGVELAGTIVELARKALARDFRRIETGRTRVHLIEAGDRLLPGFTPALSNYTAAALSKLGVDVMLNSRVTGIDEGGVTLEGGRLEAGTVLWAAGVAASPAARWLDAPCDRVGRVEVLPDLSVPNHKDVFAIGDTVSLCDRENRPLPGVAAVAKQQGRFVGRNISRQLLGKNSQEAFRYRDVGMLATIGRRAAVADLGWVRFKGWLAWWFWGAVHIYFLINLRTRIVVATNWFWSYLTFDRGARLITRAED